MRRDLEGILSVFYAIDRKNGKAKNNELTTVRNMIYKKVEDAELKLLLDKYFVLTVKKEYEEKKRLIDFIYDYCDLFGEE